MVNTEAYIPLVHKITHKRYGQFAHKYEYEDLFQVGCIGLMSAAKKFDESRDVKFSTYAYTRIDGYICNFVRDDRWFLAKNGEERIKASAPFSLDKPITNARNEKDSKSYLTQLADLKNPFEYTELKVLLDKLPYLLKKVIQLKYFGGLMQREISLILGIKQVRVSRYEKKALGILREEMMG
jgi:RNA polymerase sporulation-specific sigma factor